MIGFIIIVVVLVVLWFYLSNTYNLIIKLRNKREQSFADIDVQLKLRFDLVPNLVNTVKWYASHEKETLEKVTEARTKFLASENNIEWKMEADNMLTSALKSIFAVAESYPDLKANTSFENLQNELSDIENKLAASRRFFNNTTNEYNTYIQMFPTNLIAWIFSFKELDLFKTDNEEERKNVKVNF